MRSHDDARQFPCRSDRALLVAWLKDRAAWVLAAYPAAVFVYFQVQTMGEEGSLREVHAYLPSMSIALSFSLDGLSMLFGGLRPVGKGRRDAQVKGLLRRSPIAERSLLSLRSRVGGWISSVG